MGKWLEVKFLLDTEFVKRSRSRGEAVRRVWRAVQWARDRLRAELCVEIVVHSIVFHSSDSPPFSPTEPLLTTESLKRICDHYRVGGPITTAERWRRCQDAKTKQDQILIQRYCIDTPQTTNEQNEPDTGFDLVLIRPLVKRNKTNYLKAVHKPYHL